MLPCPEHACCEGRSSSRASTGLITAQQRGAPGGEQDLDAHARPVVAQHSEHGHLPG